MCPLLAGTRALLLLGVGRCAPPSPRVLVIDESRVNPVILDVPRVPDLRADDHAPARRLSAVSLAFARGKAGLPNHLRAVFRLHEVSLEDVDALRLHLHVMVVGISRVSLVHRIAVCRLPVGLGFLPALVHFQEVPAAMLLVPRSGARRLSLASLLQDLDNHFPTLLGIGAPRRSRQPHLAASLDLSLLVVARMGQYHPLAVRLPRLRRRCVVKSVDVHVEGTRAGVVKLSVRLRLPRAPPPRAPSVTRPRLTFRRRRRSRLCHR